MNTNVELKETITLDEYKAWLMGLLRGKGNQLPDLNDWKAIKKMMDKIVPDVIEMQNPSFPQVPYTPVTDDWKPWWETQPTCTNDVKYLNGTTITSGSTSVEFKDSGEIAIIGGAGLTVSAPATLDDDLAALPVSESYDAPETGKAISNEIDAEFILNEIRKRSKSATQENTPPLTVYLDKQLAQIKKRLQE